MVNFQKGAIRLISLMKTSQQEKMVEILKGNEPIGISFPVKNLIILIKCENGSLIKLVGEWNKNTTKSGISLPHGQTRHLLTIC